MTRYSLLKILGLCLFSFAVTMLLLPKWAPALAELVSPSDAELTLYYHAPEDGDVFVDPRSCYYCLDGVCETCMLMPDAELVDTHNMDDPED